MNVLVVALDVFSGVGGMQQYTRRFVRCLGELDRDVRRTRVLSLWDRPRDASTPPAGVRVITCSARKLAMLVAFVWCLLIDRPAVIVYGHVRLTPLAFLARVLSPGARSVLLTHGIEVWTPPGAATRTALRRIDRIASVSAFTAGRVAGVAGKAPSSVILVPPAVDADAARIGAEPEPGRILTVSRLAAHDRDKGVERLLTVMPRVRERVPDARLDVVGDGVLRADLEQHAAMIGVAEAVTFHGQVGDAELDRLYARASVFALPSTKEGFGIVYLEAWLRERPVLAGSRDAGAEVVSDGVTGRVVDPDDSDALCDALVAMLTDVPTARAMGLAGATQVRERYAHERFRDDVRALVCDRTAVRVTA